MAADSPDWRMKWVAGMRPKPPRHTNRTARAGRYSGELNLYIEKVRLTHNFVKLMKKKEKNICFINGLEDRHRKGFEFKEHGLIVLTCCRSGSVWIRMVNRI